MEPSLPHPAQLSVEDLLAECEINRTLGQGSGEQHCDKVETAIVIVHKPTGVRGEACEERSQRLNRQMAILRLRINLALKVRTEIPSEPSFLWRRRVTNRRISVSAKHRDFPALLAEVLDSLDSHGYSMPLIVARFGVKISQIVKFLKLEPAALDLVNCERENRGKSLLR